MATFGGVLHSFRVVGLQVAFPTPHLRSLADGRLFCLLGPQLDRLAVSCVRRQSHQVCPTCAVCRGDDHPLARAHRRQREALGHNVVLEKRGQSKSLFPVAGPIPGCGSTEVAHSARRWTYCRLTGKLSTGKGAKNRPSANSATFFDSSLPGLSLTASLAA